VTPVQVLVDLTQRMTVDRLRSRASLGSASTPTPPQAPASTSRVQLPYDPSAVLLLEILTSIVTSASGSITELWSVRSIISHVLRLTSCVYRPIAFDFLGKVLASANNFSSLFNERVVASLLRLVVIVIKLDDLRDSAFLALDMLRSLSPTVLASVAEPLMTGLSKLFVENAHRLQ
jgi:brefeldin A-resistance guanine nucleotide exchange factor 1